MIIREVNILEMTINVMSILSFYTQVFLNFTISHLIYAKSRVLVSTKLSYKPFSMRHIKAITVYRRGKSRVNWKICFSDVNDRSTLVWNCTCASFIPDYAFLESFAPFSLSLVLLILQETFPRYRLTVVM